MSQNLRVICLSLARRILQESQRILAVEYLSGIWPFIPSRMGRVLGLAEGVEFFGGDVAEFEGGFAEADLGVMGGFGDLRGVVIADFGDKGSDQHHRIVDVVVDLLAS